MIKPTEYEKEYLKRFYTLLRDNLRREKAAKNPSVLIALLKTRSASRYRILSNSTIPSNLISNDIAMALLSKNYIQILDNIDKYVITAQGVWQYEQELGVINEPTFLEYINQTFFNDEHSQKTTKSELDDKEKVILFSMIAARAFSEKSAVDLKKPDAIKEKWQEVLEKSYVFLKEMGIVNKDKTEIFHKGRNEHITTYMFRHNNYCLQKTHKIYQYKGNYEYYLRICVNNNFSKEELSYLLWKIFKGDHINSVDSIAEFFNAISKYSIYLFDMKDHLFCTPYYDSALRECILESIMLKDKWSTIS
jgi:L-rhamnose mutarotase